MRSSRATACSSCRWRNADQSIAHKTWDDYIEDGVAQRDRDRQARSPAASRSTRSASASAARSSPRRSRSLAARGEHPAASMTLLTTMLDFSDTGVLDVFIDERTCSCASMTIGGKNGAQPAHGGSELANTFQLPAAERPGVELRRRQLPEGRTPPPFDLLYWNSDSTNLPGPMYAWYLRNTYLENKLREPGKLTICGEQVDLRRIDVPTSSTARARTTSCRGRRRMRRRRCSPGRRSSCWARRAISPA